MPNRMFPVLIFLFMSVMIAFPKSTSALEENEKVPADSVSAYAPMAVFQHFAGKTMRGEWPGDNGEPVVDISYGEMILDGRAYQGTHKLQGSTYGGRTIIFYDEGAKEYIFHYFTTGGFHTMGKLDVTENGYTATEEVLGHPSVKAVTSTLTIDGDIQTVSVKYQNHDGTWGDAPQRIYRPYDGPRPFIKEGLK